MSVFGLLSDIKCFVQGNVSCYMKSISMEPAICWSEKFPLF